MPAPLIAHALYEALGERALTKRSKPMARRLPKRNPRTGRFERSGGRRRRSRRR